MLGTASSAAKPSLLSIGAAIALIGGGVFFAAKGIAAMAEAFALLNGEQLAGLVVVLSLIHI